jgi:hypothetical protein
MQCFAGGSRRNAKAGGYGTIDLSEAAAERARMQRFEWQDRGDAIELLKVAAVTVLSQYGALAVIVWNVFTTRKLFMECDSRKQGLPEAVACELTKTCIRYFALLALIISLLIALRLMARQRIYYQILRFGALLDFETHSPAKDPFFLTLAVCFASAAVHFAMQFYILYTSGATMPEQMNFFKDVVSDYLAPTAVFIAFLAKSYDTENQLVPLSKYVDEDPEAAKCIVANMAILPEASAVRAVKQGLYIPVGSKTCSWKQACEALIEASASRGSSASSRSRTNELEAIFKDKVRFVAEMWPAAFLLDHRIEDEECKSFRIAWYAVNGCVIPLTVVVIYFYVRQAVKEVADIREGQVEDSAGLLALVGFAVISSWLLRHMFELIYTPVAERQKARRAELRQ